MTSFKFKLIGPAMALLTASSIAFSARALDPSKTIGQYIHRTWKAEDGLPMNQIVSLVQTSNGYLWIGTGEGLVRFDGVNFTQINPPNLPVIRNFEISALYEDRLKTLWVGTTGGGIVKYKDGVFKLLDTSSGLQNNVVVDFAEDSGGKLWIATRGGGVNVLSDGKWKYFTAKDGLLDNVVNRVLIDNEERVWLGTEKGLNLIDKNFQTIGSFTVDHGLINNRISAIFQDRKGNLWIGTEQGLSVFRNGEFTTVKSLEDYRITDIIQDRNGNVWVGTYTDGLFVKTSREGLDFTTDSDIADLANIRCLYEDNESNLWVGSTHQGLSFLGDGNVIMYTTRNGLAADDIWGIVEDSDGTIWIGTAKGFNTLRDGAFEFFAGPEQGIKGYAFSMIQSKTQDRWFSADGVGVARYRDGDFQFFNGRNQVANTYVRGFYEDSKGVLWIGTVGGGLYRLENDKFTNYTIEDGLPDMRVSYITEDKTGRLWLATDGGIAFLKDGEISVVTEKDGLPINQVQIFYFDGDDNVWIGTYGGGLILYKNGKYHAVTANDGLPNNVIYSILEDDVGNLWMSTNSGIMMVAKKDLFAFFEGKIRSVSPTLFGTDEGMRETECNGGGQNPGLKASDGRLFFATIGGLAVIDPSRLIFQRNKPKVLIENAYVDGEAVEQGEEVSPGAERYEFKYTGFNYLAPKKLKFKYKLEGFDEEWMEAGARRTAYYTNIPPGKYTFRVAACNKDGVCNNNGAWFHFELEPKWTQTIWFNIGVGILIVLVLVLLVFLRVRQVRRRDRKVSRLAWEKTKLALESQVGAIKKISEETASISTNMSGMSSTLASASNDLEAAVSEAGAALEELEKTSSQSERNAKRVLESSSKTTEFARVGHGEVDKTMLMIKNVKEGSLEIVERSKRLFNRLAEVDTIVSTVNSIADQSKVLAVNASIEAASAGVHGAGFAVVAREISDLAEQIKDSTSTVSEMLTHSHNAIRDIVRTAENTTEQMEEGVNAVENSEKIVSDLSGALLTNTDLAYKIETAVEEQRSGLSLISKEIHKVYQTASKHTDASEKVDSEAKRLKEMVEQLMALIENWQTPDLYR